MRRGKPELLVATLLLLLLGSYVWYTQRVIVDLRADARRSSEMYARVFRALRRHVARARGRRRCSTVAEHSRPGRSARSVTDREGRADAPRESAVRSARDTCRTTIRALRAYVDVLAAATPADRRFAASGRSTTATRRS